MFDLDAIENDWKNNSFRLSEEEIIDIYSSEGVTLSKYNQEIEEYRKKTHIEISAEERLLGAIINDPEVMRKIELEQQLKKENKFPSKRHLSEEAQRKVIEGCLYMVFDATREWYKFFEDKISIERLYYVCLEALMNSVKYTMHCEKPVFRFYVSKSIERNIIKHVALWEHITYKEAYSIIHNLSCCNDEYCLLEDDRNLKLFFDYENKEEYEKPSKIFYQLKDECYEVDYIQGISSDEFMRCYNQSLEELDEESRLVMQMAFDISGYPGLTYVEMAEYLGINPRRISTIKKRAIKTLRNDIKLNRYVNN